MSPFGFAAQYGLLHPALAFRTALSKAIKRIPAYGFNMFRTRSGKCADQQMPTAAIFRGLVQSVP